MTTTPSPGVAALLAADQCLSTAGGRLHIEEVACGQLAAEFGTPLHVLSERQLRYNAQRWHRALSDAWPSGPVLVMPSLKANYGLAVRALLNEEQLGCDVFGPGELEIALRAGVPAHRISLNGATKPNAALQRAIDAGVRITLDSAEEFARVARLAAGARRPASVRFRIRPELDELGVPSDFAPGEVSAADAIRDYRAGMPWDEVLSCFAALADAPALELTGLMAHVTRQSTDLRLWASLGRALGRAVAELIELDPAWRPRELDIGGGFAVPRDPLGHALAGAWAGELAPSPGAYLAAVAVALADRLRAAGVDPSRVQLEAEPGRAMFADAGIHLATVLHIKRDGGPRPRAWIEADTSEAFLPDTIIEGNRWHTVLVDDPARRDRLTAAITGVSCGWDVLVPEAEHPAARVGELLAFLDTGAHQDAASNNFNALPRPATVLVSGARARLVRRRETLDDILGRDLALRPPPGSATVGLDHVGVHCADLERALAFYHGLLGIPVRERGTLDGADAAAILGRTKLNVRYADLELGWGRTLELLELVDYDDAAGAGATHVALGVADAHAVHRSLTAAGVVARSAPVTLVEPGHWHGSIAFYVSDPDGVTVELIQRPEQSRR